MEIVYLPRFFTERKNGSAMYNLGLFSAMTEALAAERKRETDVTVSLMKHLAYFEPTPGVPCLKEMFKTLTDLLFELHLVNDNCKKLASAECSKAKIDIFTKDTRKNIQQVLTYQALIQKEHIQTMNQLEECAFTMSQIKSENIGSLLPIKRKKLIDKELIIRDQLKTVSLQLANMVKEQIQTAIQKARDQLLKIVQETAVSRELVQQIESLNAAAVAHTLFLEASDVYSFPSKPQNMIFCNDSWAYIQKGSRIGQTSHIVKTFGQNISDNAAIDNDWQVNTGIYVTSTVEYNNITGRDLKLERGDVIKSKMVSGDKSLAFGWKKDHFGRKSWGFFPTESVEGSKGVNLKQLLVN